MGLVTLKVYGLLGRNHDHCYNAIKADDFGNVLIWVHIFPQIKSFTIKPKDILIKNSKFIKPALGIYLYPAGTIKELIVKKIFLIDKKNDEL